MSLKKPSDFFEENIGENNSELLIDTISDGSLREELGKVESLSEQITQLQQELSQKVVQTDLEKLVFSQINYMQENFSVLQNDFRTTNKKDISEFKEKVSELTDIVENILEVEFPKYKKQITKNQFNIGEKLNALQEVVEDNIDNIKEDLDLKLENVAEAIDENLEYFNQQLQETSTEVKKTSDTYNKLSKIVESRISKESEKLEEYSKKIKSLYESFVDFQNLIEEKNLTQDQNINQTFTIISSEINNKIEKIDEEVSDIRKEIVSEISNVKNKISSEVSIVKADVVVNEQHLKKIENYVEENVKEFPNKIINIQKSIDNLNENISLEISKVKSDVAINEQHLQKVETYIQENHKQLIDLREEVFTEIDRIPVGDVQENIERLEKKIDFIRETYSKIEPEVIVKEVIKEGLLNIPPDEKTSDPLSPLDKNYVTLDQLQEHYRLFINRIQQQLSTLGGGGETRLRYLDDVVGVATNSSAYDGKYLQWNSTTNTAEFTTVSGAGVQVNSDWNATVGVSSILNKPTIPAAQVNSDWNATTGISSILNKPTIVNQIIAGTGITISPASGVGIVTISATGGGTGAATTGYYGSFYDTTTQYATGVGVTTTIKLNTTAEANGFSIQSGTRIVAQNAGVYNTQFSFQLDKASGATANIWIWLSKNGVNIPETSSVVAVQGTNAETVPAWNFIIDMIAGDYIEYKWITDDINIGITSSYVPTIGNPPISVNIPDIPSAIVTIQQIAGVVAGVGSTTQTLNQTLGYGNTSSLGIVVGVSTFGTNNNTVIVGGANTALIVNDNARVTGILTAGIISSLDGGVFSGVVTATSFSGSGSNLTGVVTSVVAGSGISITSSGGITTITNTSTNLNQTLIAGNTSTLGMSVGVTTLTTLQVTANASPTVKPVYISGNTNNSSLTYGVFSVGTLNYSDTHNIAVFVENTNNYTQAVVQNTNSGNNASTDFIVSNDLSGATNYYGDFGINSSGFTGTGPWDDPNGTYLYASAGTLTIGTDDAKDFRIATGVSTNTPVTRVTVKGTSGNVGINSTAPTSTLDVGGDVKISGIVTAASFSGNASSATYATTSGISTVSQGLTGTPNITVGIITATNVTIGTATTALIVAGNARISGATTITGNLNAPGNYYVKLARTTDQTVPNSTDTLLGLSVVSDPNSWYSGITTRTTPTVAGTYHIDGMVNWQAGSITNNQSNIQLRKNGSTFAISLVGIHTFSYTQNVCGIVTMNGTTDYIDFTVYTGNPTSQDVRGTADGSWSKMEIFKIN